MAKKRKLAKASSTADADSKGKGKAAEKAPATSTSQQTPNASEIGEPSSAASAGHSATPTVSASA
jgi:hypothetical protein